MSDDLAVIVGSRLCIQNPNKQAKSVFLKQFNKLKKVVPEFPVETLFEEGGNFLIMPRGLLGLIDGPWVQDNTFLGPIVDVDVDEDKLDERGKYQKPLLDEVLKKNEGVVVSPTGSGKTVMIAMAIGRIKRRTLVIVHTTAILDQMRESISKILHVTPGVIGGGKRDVRPITVGLIQSIKPGDPILKETGCLIFDEAHHVSAPSYIKVLNSCNAHYRYGFTATIKKTGREELAIFAALGPVLGTIGVSDLQKMGHLNMGTYRVIYTNATANYNTYVMNRCWYYKAMQKEDCEKTCPAACTFPADGALDKCVYSKGYFGWVYDQIAKDEARNRKVIEATAQAHFKECHPWTVVLTHRTSHAKLLQDELKKAVPSQVFLAIGPPKMRAKERKSNLSQFKSDGGILVATSSSVGEGFDAPLTSCLVRAMPSGGMVSVRQQTGRIMRPQEKKALIVDFVDKKVRWLDKLWMGRRSIYHTLGFDREFKKLEKSHEPDLFA